jgi:hypothetical protein
MPHYYLNESQQFGYVVSNEMCQLKDLEISKDCNPWLQCKTRSIAQIF